MMNLTQYERWYGRDEPPPEIKKFTVGKLSLEFQEGDLRYIRYADQELVRRIYVAIRDVNWNTIPAEITNLTVEESEDRFTIEYEAFHQDAPLEFRWQAKIQGDFDGSITFSMDGEAVSDFQYCRIGFCVLHPIEGFKGSNYRASTADGEISGELPELIAPQNIENGFETPLFPAFTHLEIDSPLGIKTIFDFKGDLFEMEDQRNWTDTSFKTYCTPIALGYPYSAEAGQKFYQEVQVRFDLPIKIRQLNCKQDEDIIDLTLGTETVHRLPKLGYGLSGNRNTLDARETELLSRLHPNHIKTELHLFDPLWSSKLDKAIKCAKEVNCSLELVVFLNDDWEEALKTLEGQVAGAPVAHMIVFHEDEAPMGSTSAYWMKIIRERLSNVLPDVLFFGGTNGNFAELNRDRPDISVMDGVVYTINPQVHGSDERTLIEAIEAQRDTVVSAKYFTDDLPVCISSVTLKPPFNQAATEEEVLQEPGELPSFVDPRQMSLFAAAWTVGSIRSLSLGGADSISYYEVTGWRGLMETSDGSQIPKKFRSCPKMVYPVYWVFSFLADASVLEIVELTNSYPLLIEGFACKSNNRLKLLLANLQPKKQKVSISNFPNGKAILKRLDDDSASAAAFKPYEYMYKSEKLMINGNELLLALKPYETDFVELNLS